MPPAMSLSLAADVEEADLERDRHGEADEDQRGRLLQGREQARLGEERVGEEALVRVGGVEALRPDEDRADGEREHDRDERDDDRLVADEEAEQARGRRRRAALGDDGHRGGVLGGGVRRGGGRVLRRRAVGVNHDSPWVS